MGDCNVCCETVKKLVSCHYCDFTSCNSCTSRFVLESVNSACMNCKKPWNREMLTQKLGKTFVTKKYKEKREKDLFETEKALLPATQEEATAQKEIAKINAEIHELQRRLKTLKARKLIYQMGGTPGVVPTKKVTKLNIKCPYKDCRGYVDSTNMKCGLCENETCKECHEEISESHTCNPNTVESVKMLKKDTKNCPNCMEGIYKIEGCDQMYCTKCNTAFSWRTGEIVIGEGIHNPHYYEYLRRTGHIEREIGDIPCGGIPHMSQMKKYMNDNTIMTFHRALVHIEREEVPIYRRNNIFQGNRDLRIKFLNNQITEKQFKTTLQRREKEYEKKTEISQILNTCIVVGSEILRGKNIHQRIESLKEFINESMGRVSKLYNCVVPVFGEHGQIYNKKY